MNERIIEAGEYIMSTAWSRFRGVVRTCPDSSCSGSRDSIQVKQRLISGRKHSQAASVNHARRSLGRRLSSSTLSSHCLVPQVHVVLVAPVSRIWVRSRVTTSGSSSLSHTRHCILLSRWLSVRRLLLLLLLIAIITVTSTTATTFAVTLLLRLISIGGGIGC